MDNIAHTLIGVGVARAGLSKRFGPGTTLTLAIASNIPDIDVFWAFWDPLDRFLLRRTHSHALITLPVLAAVLATALRWRRPERKWPVLFGLSALGIALHLLFDLVNSFGVVLLWPFSMQRFELASIFIIDLFVWAVMIAPWIAARFFKPPERSFQVAVALLALYGILCVAGHERAETLARAAAPQASVLKVFPEPLGAHRFRSAARIGDDWRLSLWHVLGGTAQSIETVHTDDAAPRVAQLRATPVGRRLERFMAAPVWTLHPDGRVDVYDLRFNSVVVPRKGTFVVTFPPGAVDPEWK